MDHAIIKENLAGRFVLSELCQALEEQGVFSNFKVDTAKVKFRDRVRNAFLGEIDEAFEEYCLVKLMDRVTGSIADKAPQLLKEVDAIDDLNLYERAQIKQAIQDRVECEKFMGHLPSHIAHQFLQSKHGQRFIHINGVHYKDMGGLTLENIEIAFEKYCFEHRNKDRMELLQHFREKVGPSEWGYFTGSRQGAVYGELYMRYGLDNSLNRKTLAKAWASFIEVRKQALMDGLDPDIREGFLASHEYEVYVGSEAHLEGLKEALAEFQTRKALINGLSALEKERIASLGVDFRASSLDDLDYAIGKIRSGFMS